MRSPRHFELWCSRGEALVGARKFTAEHQYYCGTGCLPPLTSSSCGCSCGGQNKQLRGRGHAKIARIALCRKAIELLAWAP
jgi:hypothetical protein